MTAGPFAFYWIPIAQMNDPCPWNFTKRLGVGLPHPETDNPEPEGALTPPFLDRPVPNLTPPAIPRRDGGGRRSIQYRDQSSGVSTQRDTSPEGSGETKF